MTDANNIKFSYSAVKFAEDYTDFQLKFEKPEEVSIGSDPERLIVELTGFKDE